MERIIRLIKIGEVDESTLKDLAKSLELKFKEHNITVDPSLNIMPLNKSWYNKQRGQYNASKILNKITSIVKSEHIFRVLGIIDQDIYTESLYFVFGLAKTPRRNFQLHTVEGLISIKRLRESFYRRTQNKKLFEERILKEAIHELGHTFGLLHCNKFCIMRFSNSLADTDNKPPEFCNTCLDDLKKFFEKLDNSF
ncbi:MAG: archaemetzincin family Zn-dependent metalloprotease [Promethearchaeota archaeon]